MDLLDFIQPSRLQAVRQANQRALSRVDRSARGVANSAVNRGAVNPAAAAGAAARASNDARARVADGMAQREAQAKIADDQRGAQLAGSLLQTGGSLLGLLGTGGVASPAIGAVTNAAGGAVVPQQPGRPGELEQMSVLGHLLGRR